MYRKLIQMRNRMFLPALFILLLVHGMVWAQSVRLVSGGVTIDLVCESAGNYQFIGSNPQGIPGTFQLFTYPSGNPVSGAITDSDPNDNMAILNPAGLDGEYRIQYSYSSGGGITTSVSSQFTVTLLDDIEIQNLPEVVCKNDSPYPLVPVPSLSDPGATYTFSGPGVSGNQTTGYYYNPASPQVSEGWITISLFYNSSDGCHVLNSISVYNGVVPALDFSTTPSCIPAEGALVQFNNQTSGRYAVENWSWNFGDPDSGPNNTSTEENPQHFYPRPGLWSVRLTAQTYDGCVASINRNVVFSDQPVVDFTWITDCFIRNEQTPFINLSESPYATIDNLQWTFRNSGGSFLGRIDSNDPEDTVYFSFTALDSYDVTLAVENDLGCTGSLTKTIDLKPIYTLTSDGYLETFDDRPADWLVDSEDGLESWVLGEPDFTGFTPVEGDLAWYTDLPGSAVYLEHSWVESPCFDLSAFSVPLVQLDIMKSFVPGTDGAVMQYQYRVSDGWNTLGVVNEGINWYNSYGIFNKPGGSTFGWGLSLFDPDEEWVHSSYGVDALVDIPYVKFRLAIGTGGREATGNEGFAFDNFYVGERNKNSILEHFTNSASSDAIAADKIVEQFVSDYSSQVTDLQYHMDYPGEDPMNLNNPVPPLAREFNYGVPSIPYSVLNGGSGPGDRFDYSSPSEQPDGEALKASSLQIPQLNLSLSADFLWNHLKGEVLVSSKSASFNSNVQLYVVVIEKLVTAYTGANQTTSFRNVVLDILPSAAGKLLGDDWADDTTRSVDFSWNYAPYVEDVEDLQVVAFVVDRDRDVIIQSAVADYSPGTGLENRPGMTESLAVYPNPARDYVYINFGADVNREGQLAVVDFAGRTVMTSEVSPGYSIMKLDLSDLSAGVYLVQWKESGRIKGGGKLVLVR